MFKEEALEEALIDFFTSTVELPGCPYLCDGLIWWEKRGDWEYPWRIVRYTDGIAQGYPCGEPRKI